MSTSPAGSREPSTHPSLREQRSGGSLHASRSKRSLRQTLSRRTLSRTTSRAHSVHSFTAGRLDYHPSAGHDDDYSEPDELEPPLEQTGKGPSDLEKGSIQSDKEKEESSSEPTEEVEEVESPSVQNDPQDVSDEEKNVAKKPSLSRQQSSRSKQEADPNLVTWDGPDDPDNPKNWSSKRKWAAVFVVASFTFISPVSSSMVAPSLNVMSSDLGIHNQVESQMQLSIFVLAFTIGPLFLGPLSEVFGRIPVLQIANLFYFVWNLACSFAKTGPQMLVFRFLSGLGGSAPLAVGGGVLSDLFRAEQRGRAISTYSLMPLLGPALGPIAGGFITDNTNWRWAFWATCIADVAIQLSGLFLLRETYPAKLLGKKTARLRKETGNEKLYSEFDQQRVSLGNKLLTSARRPFRLLFTQPIIQVLAVYQAFIYGLAYLILASFPTLFTSPDYYDQRLGVSGLNYISLGVGFFLGSQIAAPLNDRSYRRLKARNNGVGQPEYRCPAIAPGAILVPVGLFWYGWSAQARLHWIMPDIGAALFSAGMIIVFQTVQTYIVDSYTRYAASGIAAVTVLRSLAGFGFPLFAPYLYQSLDYGWGNSLLGFIAIAIGIPAPYLLWKYGPILRGKSAFAAGG
ncbi:MAG: hypothetical protein M1828_002547 [Chrysothrix sp. TS-e1954]|nr:MAG: hypothetical protein M1828_002547 [Chrysothrix sp. TS-e1954]